MVLSLQIYLNNPIKEGEQMTLTEIDELTGDIIEELFPDLDEETTEHDVLYSRLHSFLKSYNI